MVIEVKRNQFIIAENEFLKISFLMGAAYQRASAQVAASMDLDRRSYTRAWCLVRNPRIDSQHLNVLRI